MTLEIYRRKDDDWAWRLKAANGRIVAVSGEGYKNLLDCATMAHRIINEEILVAPDDDPDIGEPEE